MKSERGPLSREQRIRKQAELQSLYGSLANLRERETSYIDASARIPELFHSQLDDTRRQIAELELELAAPNDDSAEVKGRELYALGFEAELAGEFSKAEKAYKKSARYSHRDASAAIRSVRYQVKRGRTKTTEIWLPTAKRQGNNRWFLAVVLILLLILVIVLLLNWPSRQSTQPVIAVEFTSTPAATVVVQLIIPNTPTPQPTATLAPSPLPSPTQTLPPTPIPDLPVPTVPLSTPDDTPTPVPTLMPPLRIIGPDDGLVWNDGAIVFEFEPRVLNFDEMYCLTSIRGYDYSNTENWSYQPVGNNRPYIAIDANVFRVAKVQGMQCVSWSAGIGKGSCDNIISQTTVPRVIGLPRACDF